MVTLLDCIYRVPSVIEGIVARREETFAPLLDAVKDRLGELNEIMFIGSGTSNTCSLTAYRFVEKASKLSTSTMIPNEFLAKTVYNPKALYVFVSQSGTSTLTQQSLKKVKALGCRQPRWQKKRTCISTWAAATKNTACARSATARAS